MGARICDGGELRIGWREWIALPDFGAAPLKAKIDTGARSSALHAEEIELFERRGARCIRFVIFPILGSKRNRLICESPLHDTRQVRNSNGHTETRYFIHTKIELGSFRWSVELNLSDRKDMKFPMLLGRTALLSFPGKLLIEPDTSYRTGKDLRLKYRKPERKP